jgi:cytoskeletal protein CcmA (bactofilin family)
MNTTHTIQKFALIFAMFGTWLYAQDSSGGELDVPESKIEESGEIKIFKDLHIPEGEVRAGALRVVGADLQVDGRVTGRITVLGGDVHLGPTAEIEGAIFAIGGAIIRDPKAKVTGEVVELNRGKMSISRKKSREIFGDETSLDTTDDELDFDLDYVNGDDDDDWEWENRRGRHRYSKTKHRHRYSYEYDADGFSMNPDFGTPDDPMFRYSRAEGAAIYVPFNPDTYTIPGFEVHSYLGYAFGAKSWYGRLGVGQYLFNGRLGIIVEGHREPKTNDLWRVKPMENFLGALLIHEDWYDYYQTEGYSGSIVFNGPVTTRLAVSYLDEKHTKMENTVEWSLFGGEKLFRPALAIADSHDVTVGANFALGNDVDVYHRQIRANFAVDYRQSTGDSDFDYARKDITANLYLPFHRDLGVRLFTRFGGVDGSLYGRQHQVALGGIGSVGGYDYKSLFTDNHNQYAAANVAFTLRSGNSIYTLLWNYGNTWDADKYTNYTAGLQEKGVNSVGLGFGGDDFRLQIYKPLANEAEGNWMAYIRFIEF